MFLRPVAADRRHASLPATIQILVGAGFLVAVGYGIVAPVLPTYAESFGVGVTAASAVVSAFAACRLLFAPATDSMLRGFGELRVFGCGLLIVGASSALCAFATDYLQLLIFRAAGGIGSTMFTVSAAALLIRISPATMRGRAAGAWATGFLLGTVAGPLVGSGLTVFGPRAPFLVYAGLLAVVVVIVAAVLPACMREAEQPDRPITPTMGFREALRHPTFRAALSTNFLNGWNVYGVRVALVPLFIVAHLGWSSGWAGAALAAFAAGTAITSLVGGRLADRYGRRPIVRIGLGVVAVTMCWLALSTSPAAILYFAFVSGAGSGLINPPTNAAVADVITAHGGAGGAGATLAAYQMVGDVGAIVGPVVAGMIVEEAGYPAAFIATAVIAVAALAWWQQVPETEEHRRKKHWDARYGVATTMRDAPT